MFFSYCDILLTGLLASDVFDGFFIADENARLSTAHIFEALARIMPYIGVAGLIVGAVIAVLSIRNKGWRRWGVRVAAILSTGAFLFYICLCLVHDLYSLKLTAAIAEMPADMDSYNMTYYQTLERLDDDALHFVFGAGAGDTVWYRLAGNASKVLYNNIYYSLAFVSVQMGLLFALISKGDRALRTWSVFGLCIIIPAALLIGQHYIV